MIRRIPLHVYPLHHDYEITDSHLTTGANDKRSYNSALKLLLSLSFFVCFTPDALQLDVACSSVSIDRLLKVYQVFLCSVTCYLSIVLQHFEFLQLLLHPKQYQL